MCPCVVRKATAHVETKTLNMRRQAQKGFRSIFVGIPKHQKGYLVNVPSSRKIIFSYDVVFGESFSSALAYTSQHYSEAMAMRLEVKYTPYDISSMEQTGNIITFSQLDEGNLLSETHNDAESGDESNDDSIVSRLLSEEDMDAMNSGDKSDHDFISTEILEDIFGRSQTHPNVNRREARYKIRDLIRQR